MTPGNDEIVKKNHHCTCVEINSVGVMIEGESGTGKTSLALGLLNAARQRKADFKFICDDQAFLHTRDNRLWACVPQTLAGKVELFGSGIVDITYARQCRIDLVCELIKQEEIERYPTVSKCARMGIALDYVQTPARHEAHGIRILLQKLSLPL
jgi:serine kinase of HPr protein (carbohydrate metabolism regulator)